MIDRSFLNIEIVVNEVMNKLLSLNSKIKAYAALKLFATFKH